MKIRNGFVSNSSTASFVIFGIKIASDKLYSKTEVDEYGDKATIPEYDRDNGVLKESKLQVIDDYAGKAYIGIGEEGDECGLANGFQKVDQTTIEKIKAALEPLGLWDEKSLGLYYGTVQR